MAREYCARHLIALGFTVTDEPFEYSRFPGAWATPLGGLFACLTIAAAGLLGAAGSPRYGLVVLVAAIAAGALAARWVAMRGVLGLSPMRASATNLVAARGVPAVWLVAHLDSKSQPVPMLARIAGVVGSSVVLLVLIAMCIAATGGADAGRGAWLIVTLAGIVATAPIVGSTVGTQSAGAVDNASGVAVVLHAAALLARDAPVGVVLTSAEELGMAGAHAFAARHAPGVALNVDGVDDRGTVICMAHGGAPRARQAVAAAARARGARVRVTPTIPGILTDGVALANAGWSVATLSRGSMATLARVHRATDNLDALRGDGLGDMAALVAAATREIV